MKEVFLHYIWQYKLFIFTDLVTEQGERLHIIRSGEYAQRAGPDFFNSLIVIGNQKWAGNIEIHVKASDWYLHRHEQDENYNNVILHVVWDYDIPVLRKDQSQIPVLVLSKYVDHQLLSRYEILSQQKKWIYCEDFIGKMDVFKRDKWLETLFFERLESKVEPIKKWINETKTDWERVFFCQIAQGFGLNANGNIFLNMAKSLPIKVIQKERIWIENLEAIFFGKTNIIMAINEDAYSKNLWKTWSFLSQKYQLSAIELEQLHYFKLRPDNFPTIRLSQLASLLNKYSSLFDAILSCKKKEDFYRVFDVKATEYWTDHYVLDKMSPSKIKRTTKAFIDLLIINTVIPLTYVYHQNKGEDCSEFILDLISSLKPEKNRIIDNFSQLGLDVKNAFDTQALLELKKNYCDAKKCLHCGVGRDYLYTDYDN